MKYLKKNVLYWHEYLADKHNGLETPTKNCEILNLNVRISSPRAGLTFL